jgi:hypothetical protein
MYTFVWASTDHSSYLDDYDGDSSRRPNPYRVAFTPGHDRVQVLLEADEGMKGHADEIMNDTSKAYARPESSGMAVQLIWADLL